MKKFRLSAVSACVIAGVMLLASAARPQSSGQTHPILLRAAHLLDIESGEIVSPAEILIEGERIAEVGKWYWILLHNLFRRFHRKQLNIENQG